jgi:hypothetical protein
MAGKLSSALLDSIRPQNQPGQPEWVYYGQQYFSAPPPAGTQVKGGSGGAQHWSVLGVDIGSTMPATYQAMANAIIGVGADDVYYVEAWYQDGRVLGTGYVTWDYVCVYKGSF